MTSPELSGCAPLDNLALARGTVDRVTRRRMDKDWIDAAWKDPRTRVLVVLAGQALVRDDGLVFVSPEEAPAGTRFLLGEDADGVVYFGVSGPLGVPGASGAGVRAASLREVGALLPDRDAGLLTHAVALANWHDTHVRCPLDGTPTVPDPAGHSTTCPKDGTEHFPRTDPAVIMLVTDPEDRCLLARNAAWPGRRVSILAGFVEPGESAEQAVIREVAEETGIMVTNVRYVGSQPWPMPRSLMLGFRADARAGQAITVDHEELAEARWWSRAGLLAALQARELALPPSVSIARHIIEAWYGAPLPSTWTPSRLTATLLRTVLDRMNVRPQANWAGNSAFGAPDFYRPPTVSELQLAVTRASRIRVLGTGHSFNDIADSPGAQVSLAGLPPEVSVDSAARVARVAASLSYAELAVRLDAHGFALRNLASLPHISVAGATATATHGSGAANQNLSAAVAGLTLVTQDGDLTELRRGDDGFDGAVVHLGALGVVVSLVLELVPSFDVSQRVYENLPLQVLDDHFTDLMTSGYSVSLFTDWRAPRLTQIWIKQRVDAPAPAVPQAAWFTATPAPAARHPVPGVSPDACTQQLGVPGRWYDRLPHFRPEFRPSAGEELQSEYLLPVAHAVPALHALNEIRDRLAPVLLICEIRLVAADQLWLSTGYRQDSVAFHFTWIADTASVLPVVGQVEQALAPFAPRPHWGKIFTAVPADLRARYERVPGFLDLMRRFDPSGKFRNAYIDRYLGR